MDFSSNPQQEDGWTESRVYTVLSTDGGVTFFTPRAGPGPLDLHNRDGVVGVTWYETLGTSGELAFHEHFAASLDGGRDVHRSGARFERRLAAPG